MLNQLNHPARGNLGPHHIHLDFLMPPKRANQTPNMDEDTIKKIINDAVANLVSKDHMDTLMEKLQNNIEEIINNKIAEATEPMKQEILALEGKLEVFQAHLSELEARLDDSEQYSRRSCLRVFGVPLPASGKESNSDCVAIAKKIFAEMEVTVPDDGLDRVHRIGKKDKNADGIMEQPLIMKFTSWKYRTAVYRGRKKLVSQKVLLDLTPRRAKLLSKARLMVKGNPSVDYSFADVNCRLGIKTTSGDFKFFNCEEELLVILSEI